MVDEWMRRLVRRRRRYVLSISHGLLCTHCLKLSARLLPLSSQAMRIIMLRMSSEQGQGLFGDDSMHSQEPGLSDSGVVFAQRFLRQVGVVPCRASTCACALGLTSSACVERLR